MDSNSLWFQKAMANNGQNSDHATRVLKRMSLLMRVSELVVGNAPLVEQTREIARLVREAFGVKACGMREMRPDGLHLLGVSGFAEEALPKIMDPRVGIAARMITDRRPFAVLDVPNDPTTAPYHNRNPRIDFRGYAGAPMIVHDEIVGILGIYTEEPLKDFADEDLSHLQVVANHVGTAILNARLYRELSDAYDRTLEGWSTALEYRDSETKGHTMRVANLTVSLARAMGWSEDEIVHLRRGALLHDIGKMAIPDSILLKPGPLTDDERRLMRTHTERAREMLQPIEFLRPALDIPVNHHERWDGSGYPRGLRRHSIPPAARLFAVVDVWDALSTDRPYRKAMPAEEARDYLRENSDVLFEKHVVEKFLELEPQDEQMGVSENPTTVD